MTRVVVIGCAALLACGYTWPPEYVEQSRADVATCVDYARQTSPRFDAQVNGVDLETGRVDIQRSTDDSRGERAFSRCLLAVRRWRLIERHLPKPAEPGPPDLSTMAGRVPDSLSR